MSETAFDSNRVADTPVTNFHNCDVSKASCSSCPLGPQGFIANGWKINKDTGIVNKTPQRLPLAWNPVPPDIKADDARSPDVPRIAYITSAPTKDDADIGRPLSDKDADELHRALNSAGITRSEIDIFPDVACHYSIKSEELELRVREAQQLVFQVMKKRGHKDKDAKVLSQLMYPHPIDCCRPKVLADVHQYNNFIAGGSSSYRSLTNERASIIEIAGDPLVKEIDFGQSYSKREIKLIPTYHPRFVKRAPGNREEYANHIGKALRLFSPSGLNWPPFGITLINTPDEFDLWMATHAANAPFITVDIESSKDDCLYAIMDMFQIGTPDLTAEYKLTENSSEIVYTAQAMAIRFISVQTGQRIHSPTVEREFIARIKKVLEDESITKVGHNIIAYDREVLLAQYGIMMNSVLDTIFLTRAVWPDQRKGLKPVGRRLTDVGRWENKEKGVKALDAGDDYTRFIYGLTDVIVNARIVPPLLRRATRIGYFSPIDESLRPSHWDLVCSHFNPSPKVDGRWEFNLLNIDQTRQAFCSREMHAAGIYVDQKQVTMLVDKYTSYVAMVKKRLAKNLKLAGVENIDDIIADAIDADTVQNDSAPVEPVDEAIAEVGETITTPTDDEVETARKSVSSSSKFRNLLYIDWKLPVPPHVPPEFGLSEDEFKTETGLNGTGNAVLLAYLGCPGLLTDLQRQIINDKRIIARVDTKILGTTLYPLMRFPPGKKVSLIHADGRVRSSIRAFVTAPGRYASARPNMQNFGNKKGQELLPTVFSCPEGRMLIGFDVDQFHIRIMANFWGIARYLSGFIEGLDPHVGMAIIMVGLDKVRGWSDADKEAITKEANENNQHASKEEIEAIVATELRKRENQNGWGPEGFNPKKKPKFGAAKALRDTAKGIGYTYAYLCILVLAQIMNAAKKMLGTLKANEVVNITKSGLTVIDHTCGRKKGDPVTCQCTIPKLTLPYIGMHEMTVKEWLENIFHKEKDWQAAWTILLERYKVNRIKNNGVGYMESYYFKRRSGNLSDGKAQEVVNFPILSTEQDAMALMEFSVVNLMLTKWASLNPRYILQVHDACKLEIDDPAGYGAPRCDPGHDDKLPEKCPYCLLRKARVKELEQAAIMQFGDDPVAYTTEGHWGWTLADI